MMTDPVVSVPRLATLISLRGELRLVPPPEPVEPIPSELTYVSAYRPEL